MNKEEIYILLKHQLQEQSEAQVEAFNALSQEVRAALDALTPSAPQQEPDTPHEAGPGDKTLAGIFRNHPEIKHWLLASGVDSFSRLMNFLDGLTAQRTEEVIAVAKKEGY